MIKSFKELFTNLKIKGREKIVVAVVYSGNLISNLCNP